MAAMRGKVTGLDKFGLTAADLRRLRSKEVVVSVHLRTFEVSPAVAARPPKNRHDYLRQRSGRWITRLRTRFQNVDWVVESQPRDIPNQLRARVVMARLGELASRQGVRLVAVRSVPGHRRRPEKGQGIQWFCVRGRVAIQIENQATGMQTIEDRFVIVQASSSEDAEARLRTMWEEYAEPYLNSSGYLVRWKLQEITDVYGPLDQGLAPAGVEVYSKLGSRRLKPAFVWRRPFEFRRGIRLRVPWRQATSLRDRSW
jgi:hypothetical protein